MARRYGKVTVTGWINDGGGHITVTAMKDRAFAEARVDASLMSAAVVEFLPEPVVFKDGDALRFSDQEVWVRVRGRWVSSETGGGGWEDYVAANYLQRGDCVRLVAEGATDAG